MLVYLIAIVLLIVAGILGGKARPYAENSLFNKLWDWRGFAGQVISTLVVVAVLPRLRSSIGLPPFTQKPLVTGFFYSGVIMVCVLFELGIAVIVNPAKYRSLLDRWKR